MNATLSNLLERAERKGTAVKRVREGSIMGNQLWGMSHEDRQEYIKSTEMVEQWKFTVHIANQDGQAYKNVVLDHYGTEIAHIVVNETTGNVRLHNYYGESNSDRDALNALCSHFNLNDSFSYRPVHGGFIHYANHEEVTA